MGAFSSHQTEGVEEVNIGFNHAYRYPPKSGNYFSGHFIMGGERFDTTQPEMYLFGENSDLNFLGSRPSPFPYPAPSSSEPSRTLKALVNIRKESLRFVRTPDDSANLKEPENHLPSTLFNIEFTFDCDVKCGITIMYFCTEDVTNSGLIYTPRDPSMNSETYHYKRGANQQFSQVCHVFDPSQFSEESLSYSFDREIIPVVIFCVAEEGEEPFQSHATIAVVEKHSDGYVLKPLKQKLFVDGLCYLLQEIYGIENKNTEIMKMNADEDPDDNGAECVICMCDLRDTLILPCRHLCLCNCCADSLRYQANNCPICRAPFRALLQIKALQKISGAPSGVPPTGAEVKVARAPIMEGGRGWSLAQQTHVYTELNTENIPPGYEAVSLIEALNGPSVLSTTQQPTAPPFDNMYVQLPQSAIDVPLNVPLDDNDSPRPFNDEYKAKLHSTYSKSDEAASKGSDVEMRLSVLMARESEESLANMSEEVNPPNQVASSHPRWKKQIFPKEDSVTRISETAVNSNVSRTLHKQLSSGNTLSPSESDCGSFIKDAKVPLNDADDIQDLTETLSLLDDLKKISETESQPNAPLELGGHIEGAAGQRPSTEDSTLEIQNVQREMLGDPLVLKNGRGSSRKGKQKRKLSRQSLGGSLSYDSSHTSTDLFHSEDSYGQDSQSLPGTPLSTSSAVSRSSDASVSSASSTRALLVSHPSQTPGNSSN